MPHNAEQQLDLLVVGLARSGTTMFTNLLTNPEKRRLCLAEPRLTTRRAYRESKKQYFRHVGAPEPITPESLAAFLFSHDRAGVKEIRSHHVRGAMRRYNPKRIALAVRDARSSLQSYYEKHQNRNETQWRIRKPFPAKLFLRTAPLMLDLLEKEQDRVVIVRYERFVQEPGYREEIAKAIDWPLDGDLGIFDSMSRKHDSGKHGKKVTTRSLSRATPTDPQVLRVLSPVLQRLADFQRAFGYPTEWDPPQPTDATQPAPTAPASSDGRG